MRVLELAIPAEIVDHRKLPILVVLWRFFGPNLSPLWTHLPIFLHPRRIHYRTQKNEKRKKEIKSPKATSFGSCVRNNSTEKERKVETETVEEEEEEKEEEDARI